MCRQTTDPKWMKKIMTYALISLLAAGCAKTQSEALKQSTETATGAIGCKQLQSKMFDSMYSYLDQERETPDLSELQFFISEKIDQIAQEQNIEDEKTLGKYKTEFNKVFEIMLAQAKDLKEIPDAKAHLQTLIEMEMEDQSTKANVQLNSQLSAQFAKVNALSASLDLSCNDTSTPDDGATAVPEGSASAPTSPVTKTRMVAGMSNVIATAYQSCKAIEIAPITGSTPNVSGITRLAQNHPDGVGGRRVIGDLSLVQQTHPYIKVAGSNTSSSCFDVNHNPLIYDYGGEPSVSNNSLSFFKDAGSGTSVLGMDCSALVSSAAAVGGLRYKPGVDNKAIFIRQSSGKFIDATSSGFTCYKNITVSKTETIKSGDIAAVNGHVVMVDTVGADPFGLKKLTSVSQCSSLNVSNFDFVVAQSSPSKSGIGINRFVAKDYLPESAKMKALFVEIGTAACKAYFNNTSSTPKSSEWGIIRHKGTTDCLAPKIQMANQSCVSSCQL
jgi:hypothetical protein